MVFAISQIRLLSDITADQLQRKPYWPFRIILCYAAPSNDLIPAVANRIETVQFCKDVLPEISARNPLKKLSIENLCDAPPSENGSQFLAVQ